MDNDFLHKVDLETLKKEVGLSIEEIGNLAQLKNPKGVYNWSKDKANNGTRPPYNAVVRLLQKGATVKTLFGVEPKVGNAEFREGMADANDPEFNAKVERVVLEMKSKGQL